MTASRQPKASATLRAIASMCAVLWFVGPLLCGAGRISECEGHDQVGAGEASPAHHHDVAPAHDHEHEQSHGVAQAHQHDDGAAQPEHSSEGKKPCDEKLCCSTMQALLPTTESIIIANPLSQQLVVVCLLNAASEQSLDHRPMALRLRLGRRVASSFLTAKPSAFSPHPRL